MKKIYLILGITLLFQSCIVTTATKVVTTVAKVGYGVVKGTVKGISWAVGKASGKIDEDKLDGTWKLVGIYKGNFEQFSKEKEPSVLFSNPCGNELNVIEFKAKKSKFKPLHCANEKEGWIKYEMNYGKNPNNKEKENYIEYNGKQIISVIDATNKTMVLEGNLLNSGDYYGTNLFLFEKK